MNEIVDSWNSYPSIFNLGHKAIADLLKVDVNVEEKIDGSQFSFCLTSEGQIRCRSKGVELNVDSPEKMFSKAVEIVKSLSSKLTPNWTYRAEYLAKPKHNTLAYERIPSNHLIIFDVTTGLESYLSYEEKVKEAQRIGLEVVPLIATGIIANVEDFKALLESQSILGKQKVEGVVVKPKDYNLFGRDKKVLMGKYVSDMFKEAHSLAWKESNPSQSSILQKLSDAYQAPGRWLKAVQHMKESGLLQDSTTDIGLLIKEIPKDILKECEFEIKDKLFEWAWPHIQRGSIRGFPEWYKQELLKKQFETTEVSS